MYFYVNSSSFSIQEKLKEDSKCEITQSSGEEVDDEGGEKIVDMGGGEEVVDEADEEETVDEGVEEDNEDVKVEEDDEEEEGDEDDEEFEDYESMLESMRNVLGKTSGNFI